MKEEKNMKKRTISLMLVGAMVATMFAVQEAAKAGKF